MIKRRNTKRDSTKNTKKELHPDHIKGVKRITKSPKRKKSHVKIIIITAITCAIVVAGSMIAYTTSSSNNADTEIIDQNIQDALQTLGASDSANLPQKSKLESTLGFSVEYDKKLYDVSAQTTDPGSTDSYVFGTEYDENEVDEVRPYSIMKFRLPETDSRTGGDTNMSIITNIRKSYWENRQGPSESKIDTLVRINKGLYKETDGWAASNPEDISINGNDFKHVIYTYTSKYDNLEISDKTEVFLTVQNERPYTISIYEAEDTNKDKVNLFKDILSTIKFDNFDEKQLSLVPGLSSVLGTSTEELSEDVTNTPYDINPETVFNVILLNQPAVVRVATIRCADIALKSSTGEVVTNIKDVCSSGIGSGSIVSEDGYIATNGHVVSMTTSNILSGYINSSKTDEEAVTRIKLLLEYLIKANIASTYSINQLTSAFNSGTITFQQMINAIMDAINLNNVGITNDETTYTIQLGTEAMQLNDSQARLSIDTSSTIVNATLIGKDFDESVLDEEGYQFNGTNSDVALLKVDGNFPTILLGSIDTLTAGSGLTAIGYPGFVDGGIWKKQDKTKPTVTQGKVVQIGEESFINSRKLIVTTVPIAQGNSGGPSFDDSGLQIGLNTYGTAECPDLQCFGAGVVRDIADFTTLASNNSINIKNSSKLTSQWQLALDDYLMGNYQGADKTFQKIIDSYPAHYLASRMSDLTKSKFGSPSDRSSEFSNNAVFVYIAVGAILVLVIVTSVIVVYLVRGSHKANKKLYMQPINQPMPNLSIQNQVYPNPQQPVQQIPNQYSPPQYQQPSQAPVQRPQQQTVTPSQQGPTVQPTQRPQWQKEVLEQQNDKAQQSK